jgi:hypothetical protein
MVWLQSRGNQHWHNWRGIVDIWQLILHLRLYDRLNDLIFSVYFSHCEGVLAEGAIGVHIMAPWRQKMDEAFDDTKVWLWLDWHCMDGVAVQNKSRAVL